MIEKSEQEAVWQGNTAKHPYFFFQRAIQSNSVTGNLVLITELKT